MALHRELLSAWYAWRNAEAPIANSRQRRSGAPTYDIEVELDHLINHIYGLGLWAIEGKTLNYTQLAQEEIANLEQLNAKLKGCGINDETQVSFAEYISLTRRLLKEMNKLEYNLDAV